MVNGCAYPTNAHSNHRIDPSDKKGVVFVQGDFKQFVAADIEFVGGEEQESVDFVKRRVVLKSSQRSAE